LGVKDGLPLADGALFSSHPQFGLRGTAALLAAASARHASGVPECAVFTGFKSDIKDFFIN
jgi:hypothetical protein